MTYRMGTDTGGTQGGAWIGPSRDARDIYGVRLGVERVELVLPLWSCEVHITMPNPSECYSQKS